MRPDHQHDPIAYSSSRKSTVRGLLRGIRIRRGLMIDLAARAAAHRLHIEPAPMRNLRALVAMNDDGAQHAELEHDLVHQLLLRPGQMIHPGAVHSVE